MKWLAKAREGLALRRLLKSTGLRLLFIVIMINISDEDENESDMASMQESIRQRFEIADGDKDGRLSQSEFGAFVHPDRHEEMLEHLVQDQLSRFDKDTDGKISFDEYMSNFDYNTPNLQLF